MQQHALTGRLILADVARGLALLAMAIYHFSWDLTWFGIVGWNVAAGPDWRLFAQLIAGSFLFLVGFSLVLAHKDGIRWKSFWRREVKVAIAALAVSVVTYFVFQDQWVRFGILHSIVVSSLLALPFLRVHYLIALLCGAGVILLYHWMGDFVLPYNQLFWLGLTSSPQSSVDYVPLIPWFGPVLLGVGCGSFFARYDLLRLLRGSASPNVFSRFFAWFGRHSLATYLLHQPILFGLVWTAVTVGVIGNTSGEAQVRSFQQSCVAACSQSVDVEQCERACACTSSEMIDRGLWEELLSRPNDPDMRELAQRVFQMCLQR
ncbi:membrane protein [Pseudovibrio japonicus]|uniref:Membrane protein n=1 Tax=Pseudovibrio japonicus TaxID=366534 RepID=A0ABQ3E9M6_9HYPH|nr:heparan-alpha-glucosaminide N-acetyltransferase [Pseudovibrio japonicus]GHB30718.1 membrane protein [Pseudovibrio japonicus]